MAWNWQLPGWPRFDYDPKPLEAAEMRFLKLGGELIGVLKPLAREEESEIVAEAMASEAMTTSAIEGELLDRESVRSSIFRHLGVARDARPAGPREEGIAQLMADLINRGAAPLSHRTLWEWHRMLMQGRRDLPDVGRYRTHPDSMQVVSGPTGREYVHFEAPPSDRVPKEMDLFVSWFNSTNDMPPVRRSGIAHLYFECIHPFEDGNGRIGRAIALMATGHALGRTVPWMLSAEIESRRKDYYRQLETANKVLAITPWLEWWADVVIASQNRTHTLIDFILAKTKFLDGLRGKINDRQEKALLRMFREGPAGFEGGLSSGKYQTITGASPATAGRDLAELVSLGALRRTGEGKGTRYWLALP